MEGDPKAYKELLPKLQKLAHPFLPPQEVANPHEPEATEEEVPTLNPANNVADPPHPRQPIRRGRICANHEAGRKKRKRNG